MAVPPLGLCDVRSGGAGHKQATTEQSILDTAGLSSFFWHCSQRKYSCTGILYKGLTKKIFWTSREEIYTAEKYISQPLSHTSLPQCGTFVPVELQFCKKTACNSYVQPSLVAIGGWWLVAIGGWWLATGGWWRLVVGDWWLVAVGCGWRLAVGRRWWLAVGGGWRLVVGGWRSLGAVLKGGP